MIGITPDNLPAFKFCMKRPVVVEAVQMNDDFFIDCVHGRVSGIKGDYLMRGVEGELYPCSKAVFERTYDFVIKDDAHDD